MSAITHTSTHTADTANTDTANTSNDSGPALNLNMGLDTLSTNSILDDHHNQHNHNHYHNPFTHVMNDFSTAESLLFNDHQYGHVDLHDDNNQGREIDKDEDENITSNTNDEEDHSQIKLEDDNHSRNNENQYFNYPTMSNSYNYLSFSTHLTHDDAKIVNSVSSSSSHIIHSNHLSDTNNIHLDHSNDLMDFEKLDQMFKLGNFNNTHNDDQEMIPLPAFNVTSNNNTLSTSSETSTISTASSTVSNSIPNSVPSLPTLNSNNNSRSNSSKLTLVTNPNSPEYLFGKPKFDLKKEIATLVKLAHRNKDIKLSDTQDASKREEFHQKILKKIRRKKQSKTAGKKTTSVTKSKLKRTIGRPLTPKTKLRLTLIPNLPTLYSMLVTENIDISKYKSQLPSDNAAFSKLPIFNKDIREKFKVLKRGNMDDLTAYEELIFNESVDWRFKTISTNGTEFFSIDDSGSIPTGSNSNSNFLGKSQTVTFIDNDDLINVGTPNKGDSSFPTAVGFEDNIPIYKSIDTAVNEVFGLKEYTFLRITRAAAFEKTGSIVLKMETVKPGNKWLDDDEFDLKLMFRMFDDSEETLDDLNSNLLSDDEEDYEMSNHTNSTQSITTTFLKKKIARPRYKSNMRIYLIPRISDVILYTRESMLKRDIINGTLDLNDTSDPRMIITAFEFENVLRDLKII